VQDAPRGALPPGEVALMLDLNGRLHQQLVVFWDDGIVVVLV
jgi:hypothetical protein